MASSRNSRRVLWLMLLTLASLALTSCGRNMYEQAKVQTYEATSFFPDGASNRLPLEGTVTRQRGNLDPAFLSGQGPEGLLGELPVPLTRELLERGQERYDIYCSPCHNYSGDGHGMIVQKGFVQPASFHDPRLRQAPVGYFYNAMTNGFGRMYSYASRIAPEDRWAIAGYIRALQLSQNATPADVPEGVDLTHTEGATH